MFAAPDDDPKGSRLLQADIVRLQVAFGKLHSGLDAFGVSPKFGNLTAQKF